MILKKTKIPQKFTLLSFVALAILEFVLKKKYLR